MHFQRKRLENGSLSLPVAITSALAGAALPSCLLASWTPGPHVSSHSTLRQQAGPLAGGGYVSPTCARAGSSCDLRLSARADALQLSVPPTHMHAPTRSTQVPGGSTRVNFRTCPVLCTIDKFTEWPTLKLSDIGNMTRAITACNCFWQFIGFFIGCRRNKFLKNRIQFLKITGL